MPRQGTHRLANRLCKMSKHGSLQEPYLDPNGRNALHLRGAQVFVVATCCLMRCRCLLLLKCHLLAFMCCGWDVSEGSAAIRALLLRMKEQRRSFCSTDQRTRALPGCWVSCVFSQACSSRCLFGSHAKIQEMRMSAVIADSSFWRPPFWVPY